MYPEEPRRTRSPSSRITLKGEMTFWHNFVWNCQNKSTRNTGTLSNYIPRVGRIKSTNSSPPRQPQWYKTPFLMVCKSTGGMPCDLTICPLTLTSDCSLQHANCWEKAGSHFNETGRLNTATSNDENTTGCELQITVPNARNHRLTFASYRSQFLMQEITD